MVLGISRGAPGDTTRRAVATGAAGASNHESRCCLFGAHASVTQYPNNHLLADWFAGWYIQQLVPEFLAHPEHDYEQLFRAEFLRQTYADGGNFEHSAHYHEFACEMGVAYLLLCRQQGRHPDAGIEIRIDRLLALQSALTGPHCHPLAYGNAVEDTLFPLDVNEGLVCRRAAGNRKSIVSPAIEPNTE